MDEPTTSVISEPGVAPGTALPVTPLAGIRALDLGTMITGPLAAMFLADLGAEVIKVEPPEGDPFRSFAPDGYGPHFVAFNRGKRSISLDLHNQTDRAVLVRLIAEADMLVENYRPGTLARLGFPPERLAKDYPRLVHCSITGFGADGPYTARPAYDGVAQSCSGIASLFLDPEDPKAVGPTLADNIAGYTAVIAILGALVERGRTGRGRRIEVNMLEAMMAFSPDSFATAAMTGKTPGPLSRVAASQTFTLRCGDGALLTLHMSAPEKFWTGLLTALEAPELGQDPRFSPRPKRVENYAALRQELARRFARRPRAEWMARLEQHDVPHAPVLAVAEVPDDPQVRHLGSFDMMVHPDKGALRVLLPPWRFDSGRTTRGRPPPLLGEHTGEILAELGMEPSR